MERKLMDVLENIKQVVTILSNIEEYQETLSSELSKYDCMTSDLLHYIEDEKLDAVKMCKIVKELKKVRIDRRKIKRDMELTRVFENNKAKLSSKDNMQFLMSEIIKTNKKVNCKYHNRIYSSDFKELYIKKGDEYYENYRSKN